MDIYYAHLVVRTGLWLEQVITKARELVEARNVAGFAQQGLDEAARRGFANGAFEELEDDVPAVVEEFYPEAGDQSGRQSAQNGADRIAG